MTKQFEQRRSYEAKRKTTKLQSNSDFVYTTPGSQNSRRHYLNNLADDKGQDFLRER